MTVRVPLARVGAMWDEYKPGDVMARPGAPSAAVATAGNLTVTVEAMLSGVCTFTGAGGAVAYTYPTGALISAAFPDMRIGDTVVFTVINTAAQAATMTTAASGTTVTGNAVINATARQVFMTKTAANTFTLLHA